MWHGARPAIVCVVAAGWRTGHHEERLTVTTTTRTRKFLRLIGLSAASLAAAGLGTVATAGPASASQSNVPCIGWDQLSHTPDGDHIGVTVQKLGDPRMIIFRMTTPSNIT